MKKQILTIKGELTDLNTYIDAERANKFRAHAIKRDETERVFWECKEQKIKKINKCTGVIFCWFNKDSRKDFDNIEFAQKYIWDGLVLAKIIQNDSQKYTPPLRIHEHFIDKQNPRVEVTLK